MIRVAREEGWEGERVVGKEEIVRVGRGVEEGEEEEGERR